MSKFDKERADIRAQWWTSHVKRLELDAVDRKERKANRKERKANRKERKATSS